MVLGTQVGLDTLAVGGAAGEDVLASLVSTDEANSLDSWFVENKVDSLGGSVDDVDNTVREASLASKLSKDHGRTRIALGGLEDQAVASHGGNWDGPEGNHGREVYTRLELFRPGSR